MVKDKMLRIPERQIHQNMTSMFLKGEKICYKMVYYTLCLVNCQKSRWKKLEIYVNLRN